MASRKHHKQDSTRPTKARSRRIRAQLPIETYENEMDERALEAGAVAVAEPTEG